MFSPQLCLYCVLAVCLVTCFFNGLMVALRLHNGYAGAAAYGAGLACSLPTLVVAGITLANSLQYGRGSLAFGTGLFCVVLVEATAWTFTCDRLCRREVTRNFAR